MVIQSRSAHSAGPGPKCSMDILQSESGQIESRNATSEPRRETIEQDTENGTQEPKIGHNKAENDPKSPPKWSQVGPKRGLKATPSRKTNEEPHQDDHTADLDPPRCP